MAIDWTKAKMMFEFGSSLSEIQKETGISKGSVSKKAKKDGWEKAEKATLVNDEVQNIIKQNEIATQKATLGNPELHFHNMEVYKALDKANAINMFDGATLVNQEAVNTIQKEMRERGYVEDDLYSLGAISKITETNRKQLFGITEPFKGKEEDTSDNKVTFRRIGGEDAE